MFLRPLNNEQKRLFLNLAIEAASANAVIEESEKILLEAYADEMGISVSDTDHRSMEEVCSRLKIISNAKELNQITFEIIGMMNCDNEYDEDEIAFINKMATIFKIPTERVDKMVNYVNDYSILIKKINVLMFE